MAVIVRGCPPLTASICLSPWKRGCWFFLCHWFATANSLPHPQPRTLTRNRAEHYTRVVFECNSDQEIAPEDEADGDEGGDDDDGNDDGNDDDDDDDGGDDDDEYEDADDDDDDADADDNDDLDIDVDVDVHGGATMALIITPN